MANDAYYPAVVLQLPMEGTDGSTTFTDAKGHTQSGANNVVISTAQAKFGTSSAKFTPAAGFALQFPSAAEFALPAEFTVEAWIYMETISGNNAVFTVGSTNWEVYVRATSGNALTFWNGTTNIIIGTTAVTTNVWHHVCLQRNNSTVYLYLDGVIQGTVSDGSSLNAAIVYIGSYSTTGTDLFAGYIDNFRITKGYARYGANTGAGIVPPIADMATGETVDAYKTEVLTDTPLGYWRLNDANLSAIIDHSGNNFTGVGNATGVTPGNGVCRPSMFLKGTSFNQQNASRIRIAGFTQLTTDFTIEAWAILNSTSSTAILGRDLTAAASEAAYTFFAGTSQLTFSPGFVIRSAANAIIGQFLTTPAPGASVNLGGGCHLVVTFTASVLKFYVNAILISQVTATASSVGSQTGNLAIGGSYTSDAEGLPFSGALSDVAIYGTALSQARIKAHFDAGMAISMVEPDLPSVQFLGHPRAPSTAAGYFLDASTGTLSGTVRENNVLRANRFVRLYYRFNGELLATTLTDVNGVFSFLHLDPSKQYFCVAFDDTNTAPDYNAQIYDLLVAA